MFYLIEIAKGDTSIQGKAIYEYETKNLALANYHSKIGTAMKSELYTSQLCMVINEAGGVEASNRYVVEGYIEPEPTPEPEE